MSAKERAVEIFNRHIALATTDPRAFRRTVLNDIMVECGCSVAAAATHYNTAKKAAAVPGLGRPAPAAGVRKMASRGRLQEEVVPDEECYTVIELVNREGVDTVGRCQSFLYQGEAGERFEERVAAWPHTPWVVIQGLGPNHGDVFRLGAGEKELRRHTPEKVEA